MGLSEASLLRKDDSTGKWKVADRPLIIRICARGWLPRFSALLAWRGGGKADVEEAVQSLASEEVKSSPPPFFRLRDVTWRELPTGLFYFDFVM